jgi:hypothetical protein
MANAISTQVLVDGSRNTVIKVVIVGDGSGEEVDTVIFDASSYETASDDNKLWKIQYSTSGCGAFLEWDATTNIPLFALPNDYADKACFEEAGGIINNGAAGRTGDILITTNGLGANDSIFILFYIKQRDVPFIR